jgi:hypothetical protein
MPKAKAKVQVRTAGKGNAGKPKPQHKPLCPQCQHTNQRFGGFIHNTPQGGKCSYDISCDEGLICVKGTCQPRLTCGFGRRCIPSQHCEDGLCKDGP